MLESHCHLLGVLFNYKATTMSCYSAIRGKNLVPNKLRTASNIHQKTTYVCNPYLDHQSAMLHIMIPCEQMFMIKICFRSFLV